MLLRMLSEAEVILGVKECVKGQMIGVLTQLHSPFQKTFDIIVVVKPTDCEELLHLYLDTCNNCNCF